MTGRMDTNGNEPKGVGADSKRCDAVRYVPLVTALKLEWYEDLARSAAVRSLWWVVVLALLARASVACMYADTNPATAQIWEYGDTARESMGYPGIVRVRPLAGGGEFVYPTAFMPPLPVFLDLAVFGLLGVTSAALKVLIGLNVVFGSQVVLWTGRVAQRMFGSRLISLLAACFCAINPVFVFSAATYHAVNLYLLLFLVMFDAMTREDTAPAATVVVAGAAWGLAILARTEYLVLGAVMVIWAAMHGRQWRRAAVTMIVAALFVVPWTVRNYEVFGRFIPVADSVGYNLYKGFNPEANGSGHWVDINGVARRRLGPALAAVPHVRNYEVLTDGVYLHGALEFIRSAPAPELAELAVKKVFLFWIFDVHDPTTHRLLYQLAVWPTIILPLLAGVVLARNPGVHGPALWLVLVLFCAETVVMAAYAVHARYRMNVEPFLFAFCAVGLAACMGWIRQLRAGGLRWSVRWKP